MLNPSPTQGNDMVSPHDDTPDSLRRTQAPTPKPPQTRFSRKSLNIIIITTSFLIVLFSYLPLG